MSYYQAIKWDGTGTVCCSPEYLTTNTEVWSVCLVDAPYPAKRHPRPWGLIALALLVSACGADPFHGEAHIYEGVTPSERPVGPTTVEQAQYLATDEPELIPVLQEAAIWWNDAGEDVEVLDSCDNVTKNCAKAVWYAQRIDAQGEYVGGEARAHGDTISVTDAFRDNGRPDLPANTVTVVVAHEIGHVLGYLHVKSPEQVMYPIADPKIATQKCIEDVCKPFSKTL